MQTEAHEAMFYDKLKDGSVKCRLCPWNCVIDDGRAGYCGVRQNVDGTLYSVIYGKATSVAADPIEKKPLYNFRPGTRVLSLGTYGCNMRCGHCQNWQISHVIPVKDFTSGKTFKVVEPPRSEEIPPEKLVTLAIENDCAGIAWTYNEPTIWFEYAYDGAKLAKQNDLYTVFVTNGYINLEPLAAIAPYLDAYRVDIKAFNDDAYKLLCKVRSMQPVLDAAKAAKHKHNMHVEVVTLIIPTLNDDDKQLTGIANFIKNELGADVPWHVTRFVPYLEFKNYEVTPVETLERAVEIGYKAGLKYVYIGNVAGHPAEHTYCPKCKKGLIERHGFSIGAFNIDEANQCIFCGEKIDIT
ncbi:MAG: AmmeMemoRadiSam system radical SAM enzyme [Candidatus Margulisbacteria bacterium]|nr:AmmeMemoRadiSam system radical SAM enzyme [Candidatus Margulisiibacteriota bacterium]MBU1021551.1 AmmeMemoRadiSam system radical SAM enzyme [Candidatus Margulisiibacteriota bacterium]MBU1728702.1 AmmeMemoRadiSam system radical SAM enzyme [Candidatus Margulisiibacteriota bacterium]MBU1955153.1 AmmeMemoRadiSam system radical SAM enzyme [Candidatus Margulisiibacteriota bacterium]